MNKKIQPRHVMIDLETMGTTPQHAIVSIGAVIFDPRIPVVTDKTFYMELDWRHQGRLKNRDTFTWWKGQPLEVRDALRGTAKLRDALIELANFVPKACYVWGNGSIFDIAFLEDAYRQEELEIPWKFYNIMDCRTILWAYESKRGGLNKAIQNGKRVEHNALDDAIAQSEQINLLYNKIHNAKR